MRELIAFVLILLAAVLADSVDKPLLLAVPVGIAAVLTLWPDRKTALRAETSKSGQDQPDG